MEVFTSLGSLEDAEFFFYQLQEIIQTTTVRIYEEQFRRLQTIVAAQYADLDENYFIQCCIYGFIPEIQQFVKSCSPLSLDSCFRLARLKERLINFAAASQVESEASNEMYADVCSSPVVMESVDDNAFVHDSVTNVAVDTIADDEFLSSKTNQEDEFLQKNLIEHSVQELTELQMGTSTYILTPSANKNEEVMFGEELFHKSHNSSVYQPIMGEGINGLFAQSSSLCREAFLSFHLSSIVLRKGGILHTQLLAGESSTSKKLLGCGALLFPTLLAFKGGTAKMMLGISTEFLKVSLSDNADSTSEGASSGRDIYSLQKTSIQVNKFANVLAFKGGTCYQDSSKELTVHKTQFIYFCLLQTAHGNVLRHIFKITVNKFQVYGWWLLTNISMWELDSCKKSFASYRSSILRWSSHAGVVMISSGFTLGRIPWVASVCLVVFSKKCMLGTYTVMQINGYLDDVQSLIVSKGYKLAIVFQVLQLLDVMLPIYLNDSIRNKLRRQYDRWFRENKMSRLLVIREGWVTANSGMNHNCCHRDKFITWKYGSYLIELLELSHNDLRLCITANVWSIISSLGTRDQSRAILDCIEVRLVITVPSLICCPTFQGLSPDKWLEYYIIKRVVLSKKQACLYHTWYTARYGNIWVFLAVFSAFIPGRCYNVASYLHPSIVRQVLHGYSNIYTPILLSLVYIQLVIQGEYISQSQSQPQSPVYWMHNGSELEGLCSVVSIARSGFHIVSRYCWSSMVKCDYARVSILIMHSGMLYVAWMEPIWYIIYRFAAAVRVSLSGSDVRHLVIASLICNSCINSSDDTHMFSCWLLYNHYKLYGHVALHDIYLRTITLPAGIATRGVDPWIISIPQKKLPMLLLLQISLIMTHVCTVVYICAPFTNWAQGLHLLQFKGRLGYSNNSGITHMGIYFTGPTIITSKISAHTELLSSLTLTSKVCGLCSTASRVVSRSLANTCLDYKISGLFLKKAMQVMLLEVMVTFKEFQQTAELFISIERLENGNTHEIMWLFDPGIHGSSHILSLIMDGGVAIPSEETQADQTHRLRLPSVFVRKILTKDLSSSAHINSLKFSKVSYLLNSTTVKEVHYSGVCLFVGWCWTNFGEWLTSACSVAHCMEASRDEPYSCALSTLSAITNYVVQSSTSWSSISTCINEDP